MLDHRSILDNRSGGPTDRPAPIQRHKVVLLSCPGSEAETTSQCLLLVP